MGHRLPVFLSQYDTKIPEKIVAKVYRPYIDDATNTDIHESYHKRPPVCHTTINYRAFES